MWCLSWNIWFHFRLFFSSHFDKRCSCVCQSFIYWHRSIEISIREKYISHFLFILNVVNQIIVIRACHSVLAKLDLVNSSNDDRLKVREGNNICVSLRSGLSCCRLGLSSKLLHDQPGSCLMESPDLLSFRDDCWWIRSPALITRYTDNNR